MTLEEIIGKLEQATEPSRELDREIWLAIGGTFSPAMGRWVDKDGVHCHESWTCFTRSLDAALSLVPEGRVWKVHSREIDGVSAGSVRCGAHVNGGKQYPGVWHTAYAATPALALCMASLRARQVVPVRSAGT